MSSILSPGSDYSTAGSLNLSTAVGLLILYTVIYVLPFYASPSTRPSPSISRDDPRVIRARITSVTFSTILCSLLTLFILSFCNDDLFSNPLHAMGYLPIGILESLSSLLLTSLLFAGPLYEILLIDGAWRSWLSLQPVTELLSQWTAWRNIVAGPLTEEILFRSASVPLLLCARMSLAKTIFLSPVIFGLAHIHHFYEFRITHPHTPLIAAVARSLLQLTYTSLFGAYATFLFLRTGSLLAAVLVHAFCNSIGLPRFWGSVQPYWLYKGENQFGATTRAWTMAYYVLLVAGAILWWKRLLPLTASGAALVPI